MGAPAKRAAELLGKHGWKVTAESDGTHTAERTCFEEQCKVVVTDEGVEQGQALACLSCEHEARFTLKHLA